MSWNQPYNPNYQLGQSAPPGGGNAYGSPPGAYGGGPPPQYGQPPPVGGAPPQYSGGPPPQNSIPPGGYGGGPPGGYGGYGGGPPGGYGGGPPSLPPGVTQELYTWFQAVDADKSNKITAIELREALLNNNWSHFNSETCRLLISMFDSNNDGSIDLSEFAALWKYVQDWKSCFDSFDKDRSGNIDAQELQQALQSFGYRLSMDFCNLCTRVFDRSDRRTMKFDDFIQCCVMLRSLTEGFKKLDTNRNGVIQINYEQFLEIAIGNAL